MKDLRFITEEEIAGLFPKRPSDCHKGDWGYVALAGGSLEYSGAIRLAAMANSAIRSGGGVATVAAPRSICPLIAPQIIESTLLPLSDKDGRLIFDKKEFEGIASRYDSVAFGMGIGFTEEVRKAIEWLLENYDKTLIVDADGLNAMSLLDRRIIRSSKARLVLTPHLKEFSRLSGMSVGEAAGDPASAAAGLSDDLNAVVLLKGSTTIIADAGRGICLASDRGCAGMAAAGSGDVLSGILSALCVNVRDEDLAIAAAAGAYINGAAGELAEIRRSDITMTSYDTAMCVAEVIEDIIRKFRC